MASGKVKVGIIGSGFEADIHTASFKIMPEEAEVVAVASPTRGHPEALAKKYSIPRVFHDYREMLKEKDMEMITINAPSYLHCVMTRDIACCTEDQDIEQAARLMNHKQIRRLAVLNRNQRLVGIVSLADLDLATCSGSTQLTGQTLEGISQPGMPRGIPVVEATPY